MLSEAGVNSCCHGRWPHQEGGARDGEGLFVQVGAAEEHQNVAVMFLFIKPERFCELPQLLQVRRELQPGRTKTRGELGGE